MPGRGSDEPLRTPGAAAAAAAAPPQQGPARLHGRRRLGSRDRGLSAVGYVVSIAASAPPLSSLKPRDPARLPRSSPPTARGSASSRPTSCARRPRRRDPEGAQGRDGRDRGRALLQAQGRRLRGRRPRRRQEPRQPARRCRAARRSRCSSSATSTSPSERTYQRKIREAKLAEELENEHSKNWILDKYLNTVPYGTVGGQSAIGVKAAARMYFNKRSEAHAARGGAAGRPAAGAVDYSPVRAGAAKARRNEVLRKMAELGMITRRRPRGGDARAASA